MPVAPEPETDPTGTTQRGDDEMGNDPKQGEDFVKVPMPKETDDVEGHKV